MSLRFRELLLRVVTELGPVGLRMSFPDGLVVLRAANSSGKSTCLQSLVYAMGLEGMFGASHDVPMPHAVTDRVSLADRELPVLESEVTLELENAEGERLTINRAIKGERHRNLVTAWQGPALSQPGDYRSEDFYVRMPGAATAPSGFHRRLADFIGWDLPRVSRFQGDDVPLYMETLFPLLFIEQKKGWTAMEGRFPTHFGIREVGTRAIEFMLRLDATDLEAKRRAIRERMQEIRIRWDAQLAMLANLARPFGAIVEGLPQAPVASWPPAVAPIVLLAEGDQWRPLRQAIEGLQAELVALEVQPVPRTDHFTEETGVQLQSAEEQLIAAERQASELVRQLAVERDQVATIDTRLRIIQEDLVRNKDALRLQRLGSVRALQVVEGLCPTCHQEVSAGLLPPGAVKNPMSVEENIKLLEEHERVFTFMRKQALAATEAREAQLAATNGAISDIRTQVRALKRTLVSDPNTPSEASIRTRIRLADRAQMLGELGRNVDDQLNAFAELAVQWNAAHSQLAELPADKRTTSDERKVALMERLLKEQLVEYGMDSLPPETIGISRDSYRAVHEGFDLQFDLSASDMIRTIWAWRLSLLEVARAESTNHLGFVVFDEPRQQETERASFRAFLRRASSAAVFGQQVIVATSEEMDAIRQDLRGLPHTLNNFGDRLLTPL